MNTINHPPIFLLHGFHRDSADMNDLAKALKNSEYTPVLIELPLTYSTLEAALSKLKLKVLEYINENNPKELYFIGHSTGGIVIRMLMKDKQISKITKACLFIATPNKGTPLANLHQTLLPPIIKNIHLPLKDLTEEAIDNLLLKKPSNVIYGAIAGSKKMMKTDLFFNSTNDGIVETKSVFMKELDDFIILPFNHYEIHHQEITYILSIFFLKNKVFPSKLLKEVEKGRNSIKIGDKFVAIIENGYIDELCSQLGGNIVFPTIGGKHFWNEISNCNEWKLQQNKISKHLRILNPEELRKAWGSEKSITEAINHIYERILCNEFVIKQQLQTTRQIF